jgi:hypothetical protein
MTSILAIDPGASGGLAWLDEYGVTHAVPMPDEGMTAQIDQIRTIHAQNRLGVAIVEKTGGYMPGNSGPAAATFARHCGQIEAALYCLGIPTEQVAPQKWMKALGTWPADKQDRKRAIRDEMQRRYPHLAVTLKTADSLALLTWYRQTGRGK